jgi:hypothetical protein
MREDN